MRELNRTKFFFEKKNNILCDRHIGISGNKLSVLTPESAVGNVNCLQACPFSNSAFLLDVRIGGERIAASDWQWLPNAILRRGESKDYRIETLAAIPAGKRCVVFSFTLENKTDYTLNLPISAEYRGVAKMPDLWRFSIPEGDRFSPLTYQVGEKSFIFYNTEEAATGITTSLRNMKLFKNAYLYEGRIEVSPISQVTFYFSAHLGAPDEVSQQMPIISSDYERYITLALDWVEREEEKILSKLPTIESTSKELDELYYRSLVTYITNKWEIDELKLNPYYSTGATNGGCMCTYLWDYSGGMYVHPLVNPKTNADEIELYLTNDLTCSYAIMPNGKPCGPWYQINQEKIISIVYYHVLHTGDISFLHRKIGDKTVAEWMVFHALVGDDPSRPVQLIDYGEGGRDHLELRHELQYEGVMPDLNARRYRNYLYAYRLSELAGTPCKMLLERAEAIKPLIMTLWNEERGWFDFIHNGKRDIRYTVQMFKFLDTDVITNDVKEKLIEHLNEDEFLSDYGLHSMSKLDDAYDQDDIDNGGGGICTEFAAVIIGQLYDIGKDTLASDILSRILWWGKRLPYMGDSCAANMQLQREDTPLQADISSVSLAQTILFKLSGVSLDFDGRLTIIPPKNHLTDMIAYRNFKLGKHVFDLVLSRDTFTVTYGGKEYTEQYGNQLNFI